MLQDRTIEKNHRSNGHHILFLDNTTIGLQITIQLHTRESRLVPSNTRGGSHLLATPATRATETHILWSAGVGLYPLATPMSSVGEWGIPHTDLLGRPRVAVSTYLGCSGQFDTRHHRRNRFGKASTRPSTSTSSR
jgi:hypothetical protein